MRISTGIPGQAGLIAHVHGLDSLRRFSAGTVAVTLEDLARCERDRAIRAVPPAQRKRAVVRRLAAPPRIDGDAQDWEGIPEQAIAGATRAAFRLAYDDANHYALFAVEDDSPYTIAIRASTREDALKYG